MKPRVLVTRALPERGMARLREACDVTVFSDERQPSPDELKALVTEQDGLLAMLIDTVDRDVLEAAPKLRAVSNYAVGYNNIDVDAATELGIAVTNTPGVLTRATADMAWALLMAVTRRIVEADAFVRAGKWVGWEPNLLLGTELGDQTMGIVGAGRIGLAIAKRAQAFEMNVVYYNRRRLEEETEKAYGLTYVGLDTLLATSDVVSLSVPYSPESHHLINAARLKQMKKSAFLINTARGSVVDEAALVEALRTGEIAGAGLDVFEEEPVVHPGLLELPNVVLAPHLGSATEETRAKMAEMAAENLVRVLQGERPLSLVNPDVWTARRNFFEKETHKMFEKWIAEHRDEIIAKTQGMLQINSVGGPASGPEAPFGPGCAEALAYFLNLGREMGFEVKNVDGYAGHVEFGEGDEYIAVLGHLDVVPAGSGWSHPPFGAEIHDGKIYARGTIDDKGPTMSALFALKAVKESGLPLNRRVRVIVGLDEESNWRCMDHYFSKEPKPFGGFTPDADFPLIYAEKGFLCFDVKKGRAGFDQGTVAVRELTGGNRVNMVPDTCRVRLTAEGDAEAVAAQIRQVAEQEGVQAEVEVKGGEILLYVTGMSAHASTPRQGVNAVVQAGKVLAKLDTADQALWTYLSENDPDGERLGIQMTCDVTGPLTLNLGLSKVTEENVTFTYNARYPVEKKLNDIMDLLLAKLVPEGFEVTDSPDNPNMESLYVPRDSEIVQTLLKVYREETGDMSEPITIGGATYARAIPNAVAFGALFPGQEELAHQKDENWAVDDLLRCTNIFAKAIYELAK